MKSYSLDSRQRIIKGWREDQSKSVIARTFMVSLSSVNRYVRRFKTTGNIRPTMQGHMQGKLHSRLRKRLVRQVEAHADFTLAQHADWWNQRVRVQVSESRLSRALWRLSLTRKKKTRRAAERNEAEGCAFRASIKTLNTKDLVVLDESGTQIGMIPLYARAPRGCRAYDHAPRNHVKNLTLSARLSLDRIQAAMTPEAPVDEGAFETFIRQVVLPTLHPGQIVILDNLSSHKTDSVLNARTEAGCQVLCLSAYSPDLSPIKEAFSKLKAFLRRCRCQTISDLIAAIEQGLNKITVFDSKGWFAHAGYLI